jgi:hypothetical protein
MGKVAFRSQEAELPVPTEKAYSFLEDLNNLQRLMPEQIINWKSTKDSCEFDIKGMTHISLQKSEVQPYKLVKIVSGTDNPLELELKFETERIDNGKCNSVVELTAVLSPMLQLMVSGPLQNLVNIMCEKLQADCREGAPDLF